MSAIDRRTGLTGATAIKQPCRVATTANITLSGEQTIDGVAVVADDRVLVKDQTTAADNGIYIAATSAWQRAPDFNGARDVVQGTLVRVVSGTSYALTTWQITTANPITVGTTSLAFASLGALSSSAYAVATLASLKALTDRPEFVLAKGQTALNDGWGGPFAWDSGSATAADDVITVAPTSGAAGRYKRLSTPPYVWLATPFITYSFAGHTAKVSGLIGAVAASNTVPEFAHSVQIESSTGFANDLNAFKIAQTVVASGLPGTASIWATNFVTTLASGVGAVYGIGTEIDLNIANRAYSTNAAPYATNLFLTGTSTSGNYAQAAIIMALGSGAGIELWNYGMLGVDYGAHRAFRTAFLSDQSRSPTVLHSDTAHTKGIDFASATFVGNAFVSPGFSVSGLGVVAGLTGGFGLSGAASQSVIHGRASANSFQIVERLENDNSGAGSAAFGFSVTAATGSAETRSAKAGVFLTRTASNGRGTFGLANRITDDTTDFAASNYVMQWDSANAWQLSATHFTANGTVATTTTSLGPAGSQTTIQEWLTVKNAAGTVRYIPCY